MRENHDLGGSKPRTCLTYVEKRPEQPKTIRDPVEIEKVILSNVAGSCAFIACPIPGIAETLKEQAGAYRSRFLLSHIRYWCGLGEGDDDLILAVLDRLAKRGKLKFLDMSLTRDLHYNDFGFFVEIGVGTRTIGCTDVKRTVVRGYSEKPLTRPEREGSILNVRERVEMTRKQRDEHFRNTFGWRDLELENRLHREGVEEQAALKSAILKVAELVKEHGADSQETREALDKVLKRLEK
jgi:hypothetical protein